METPVSSALRDTISIKMEFAVKFKVLVSSSTSKKESAKDAMKVTKSLTAAARPSKPQSAISDVLSGPRVYARPAPRDGTSMLTVLAFLLVISAQPGMRPQENALPATMDQLFKTETVLFQSTPA